MIAPSPKARGGLSTSEFAAATSYTVRSIERFIAEGLIIPAARTPGGHARFSWPQVDAVLKWGHNSRYRARIGEDGQTLPRDPTKGPSASAFIRNLLWLRRVQGRPVSWTLDPSERSTGAPEPKRPAPIAPSAMSPAAIRRLQEKKAAAREAKAAAPQRRRARALESVLTQLRLLARSPVSAAPWIAPELGEIIARVDRQGLNEADVELLAIMQMGAADMCGERHPHTAGLAVAVKGARRLLKPAAPQNPNTDAACGGPV